jgi:choline dehydrogenase-like flavoprotein
MSDQRQFDYIVVGSGAGGGTLAARLAEAGRSALLLEAGGDPNRLSGTNDDQPGINRLPADYDVPAFHGFASENSLYRARSTTKPRSCPYRYDCSAPAGRSRCGSMALSA